MKVKIISELEATLYTKRNLHVYKGEYEMTLGAQDLENYKKEIEENTWLVDKADIPSLMDEKACRNLWKDALSKLGGKYEMWSRFPQIPTLN